LASAAPPRKLDARTRLAALAVVATAIVLLAVVAIRLAPPGVRVAHNSVGGSAPIGTVCTHYPGAQVTIAAPAAGTIVVSATVGVGINHTLGTADIAWVGVAESRTECGLDNYTAFVSVPASLPSDAYHFETVSILRPFAVSVAGPYAFYVNALMESGYDAVDRFDSASLVATYYPS